MIDTIIQGIKNAFDKVSDHRYKNAQIPLGDYLQSAFAMFHLKDPSLHQYRTNYPEREANLERVYGITHLPSDTGMREGIDGIAPKDIQECFKVPLQVLDSEGIMQQYKVLGRYNCLLMDATEHYCNTSDACSCEHCLTKVHKTKKGEVTKTTYHHQALSSVLAHHQHKEVFPVACEAIVKQDGETKNDCELNAAKRLIPTIREMLPAAQYELLGVFDGLYPNGPFIRLLNAHHMRYIIGIKDGYVLVQIEKLKAQNALNICEWVNEKGEKCVAKYYNGLILNGQNQDIEVNYFQYEQFDTKGVRTFFSSWITDLFIEQENIQELVAIGRSRWKIENETFNTLKNQGYHLEHSYGHGKKNLATNFMLLTFLAFLTDQIAQKLDKAFDKALKYCKTKKNLWEKVRQVFDLLPCMSMNVIYRFIAKEIIIDFPLLE
jgi:Transposase DDE domain